MRFYAQSLRNILHQKTVSKTCSKITPRFSKALFGQKVQIKEKITGIVFDAWVVDYCSEDQKGFIVRFSKSVSKTLAHQKLCKPAMMNSKSFVELDLRNLFHGKLFDIII